MGQPIGPALEGWTPRPWPPRQPLEGRWARIEPIEPKRHAGALHAAFSEDREGRIWTYLPYGPFGRLEDFYDWMASFCLGDDPQFHAVIDKASGRARGMLSLLRVQPEIGVIEVGHINYAPALQKTAAASEAQFLLMERVFDQLGYRRYEWKCDALNAASCRAAERLGFRFEGVFRQATIYKGRNRDTAWFAMIDADWPAIRSAFEDWLDPANFDAEGRQIRPLRMPG